VTQASCWRYSQHVRVRKTAGGTLARRNLEDHALGLWFAAGIYIFGGNRGSIQVVEVFLLGHAFRSVEALAALAATIGAKRKEDQNPKFQKASALGAMHVIAAAHRAISIFRVCKQSQGAFHSAMDDSAT
jgi:hypothetical protein